MLCYSTLLLHRTQAEDLCDFIVYVVKKCYIIWKIILAIFYQVAETGTCFAILTSIFPYYISHLSLGSDTEISRGFGGQGSQAIDTIAVSFVEMDGVLVRIPMITILAVIT